MVEKLGREDPLKMEHKQNFTLYQKVSGLNEVSKWRNDGQDLKKEKTKRNKKTLLTNWGKNTGNNF